jgi:hypothetical protein
MTTSDKDEYSADYEGLWPEELQALEDIKSGKTKTHTLTLEEFLKEMDEIEAENP